MNEILGIALGAGGIGFLTGLRAGLRRHRAAKDPKPVCGCDHAVNFHEDHTGRCRYEHYDSWDCRTEKCSCQKYSGPVPLPTYYAPEELT